MLRYWVDRQRLSGQLRRENLEVASSFALPRQSCGLYALWKGEGIIEKKGEKKIPVTVFTAMLKITNKRPITTTHGITI